MVFPQAEFVIIPDSQAASPDYETMRSESINPKNPDVADVLRLLSLEVETMDDTETLPTASGDDENDGVKGLDSDNDNLDQGSNIYDDDLDFMYNMQESQDPTLTPSPSTVYGPDLGPHGAISAFSARPLSATIRTTTTIATLPPPGPEISSGPPAPNKQTRTSKRLGHAKHDQQPEAVLQTNSPQDGSNEVCFVLIQVTHFGITHFRTLDPT